MPSFWVSWTWSKKVLNTVIDEIRSELTITKRIWLAVTKADTKNWLNLSRLFRYVVLLLHLCSSIRSSAACAMNWLRCRWSSFYKKNKSIKSWFYFYISCRHLHFLGIHEFLLEDWVVIVAHNREVVTASHAKILFNYGFLFNFCWLNAFSKFVVDQSFTERILINFWKSNRR